MAENNELMRTLISRVPLPLSLASAAVSASSSPRSGPERRSMEAPAPVLPVMNLMLTQPLKIAARQILISRCANRFRGGRREPSTVASYVQQDAVPVVKEMTDRGIDMASLTPFFLNDEKVCVSCTYDSSLVT